VELPDEDANPIRHPYGDYTHWSPDGRYKFEWTPYTPAIKAWENAERRLRNALGHLHDARQLPGFALNGLQGEHDRMLGALKEISEDTEVSVRESGAVLEVLRAAHRDYAAANEVSLEEYRRLMGMVDLVGTGQLEADWKRSQDEAASEADRDRTIFPFDGKKD
jgi:hypothetical protein